MGRKNYECSGDGERVSRIGVDIHRRRLEVERLKEVYHLRLQGVLFLEEHESDISKPRRFEGISGFRRCCQAQIIRFDAVHLAGVA